MGKATQKLRLENEMDIVKAKSQCGLDKAIKEGKTVEVHEGFYIVKQGIILAYGQSTVEAYDQSTVEAYGNAGCIIHSPNAKAKGNILDLSKYPQTPEDWLKSYGVEIKSGYAILFKGTQKDFGTRNNVKYVPGSRVIAPGWLEENIECGNALHFCPAPFICKRFIEEPKHFVACKVAVKDIRVYQGTPSYPDKIRAKQCEALYECDINGNEIKAK